MYLAMYEHNHAWYLQFHKGVRRNVEKSVTWTTLSQMGREDSTYQDQCLEWIDCWKT